MTDDLISRDGYLTHWMPLPAPPVDSSAAPSTPVDNKISADPVGKEALE